MLLLPLPPRGGDFVVLPLPLLLPTGGDDARTGEAAKFRAARQKPRRGCLTGSDAVAVAVVVVAVVVALFVSERLRRKVMRGNLDLLLPSQRCEGGGDAARWC